MAESHPELLSETAGSYIEPFLGGAALFLKSRAPKAYLSDANSALMHFYKVVARSPEPLWDCFRQHRVEHSAEHYKNVRAIRGRNDVEAAGRFLYLNRACFNGLYRVNKRGEFNVPMGSPRFDELNLELLLAVSRRLQLADLRAGDFGDAVAMAGRGDLLVLDPPYTVAHNQNGFVRYNENIFSWADQMRLAKMAQSAVKRGAKVISTNANHAAIAALYPEQWFELRTLTRRSSMAAEASARGSFSELLILSR